MASDQSLSFRDPFLSIRVAGPDANSFAALKWFPPVCFQFSNLLSAESASLLWIPFFRP